MRPLAFAAPFAASLALASPARADDADAGPAAAVVVGAATIFAGFAVGGTLMAATGDDTRANQAGWFVIESSFAVAPFAAHGVVGEWGRGALFASIPAATTLGTIPVFAVDPAGVDHGSLPEQRIMWALFCAGLATSMAGVVDAALAPGRRVTVAPSFTRTSAALAVGGVL
jgi:hypothetical protein